VTRAGLTPERVVAAAGDLADAGELTLAALAERLGVKVPSLYKHVAGLDDLHDRLAAAGRADLITALGVATVGRAGRDALHGCATAWRAYAREHPGRYLAVQRARQDPAADRLTGLLLAVLDGYGRTGDDLVHAARAVRSAVHGFCVLEATGGFALPQDLDTSFEAMIDLLDAGLRTTWPTGGAAG
jgi:AcrR family transcriptional regulator